MASLADLEQRALAALQAAECEESLRAWHTQYLGGKGELTAAMGALKSLPPAEKKGYGQEVNRLKEVLTAAYEKALAASRNANSNRIWRPARWT